MAVRRGGLAAGLVLASVSAGCSAHRLAMRQTPYGVEDLVYVTDRNFDVTYPEPGAACTRMELVFLPADADTRVTYALETSRDGKTWRPVPFDYELVVLSQPSDKERHYRRAVARAMPAARKAPAARTAPEQQQVQTNQLQRQELVVEAREKKRAMGQPVCRMPLREPRREGLPELTFDGPLIGSLDLALLTPSGGMTQGAEYRLSFFRERNGAPNGSVTPATVAMGRFEFRLVFNNRWIGVPVGMGAGLAFLLVSTKFFAP